MGFDNVHYVLGRSGVLEYKMNTHVQKIGKKTTIILLEIFHSIIFTVYLKTYERSSRRK